MQMFYQRMLNILVMVYVLITVTVCLFFRPAIQFSSDEATACRLATNEVQFFDTGDFSKGVVCRLRVPGVAAAELSSLPGSHVAAFVPESKVCVPQLNAYGESLVRFFATK